MRPAVEFSVFLSVLLLDYHDTAVALLTCVPAGLPRVHSSFLMWPHVLLPIPYLPHPLFPKHCHSQSPVIVLHQKSVLLFHISPPLNLSIGHLVCRS